MQGRVEAQLQSQPLGSQRPVIQLGDHRFERIQQFHGIGTVAAIEPNVIRRVAVAPREAVALHEARLHNGHIPQVNRLCIAPTDHQIAQLLDTETAGDADGILAPADIGKTSGHIGGAAQRPRHVINRDTHARQPVGIDIYRDLALAAGLQIDLGNPRHTRQPRLDERGYQVFVGTDVAVEIVSAKQLQRGRGVTAGGAGAGTHDRLIRVRGQGRRLVEVGDHVNQPLLHVPTDLEIEFNIALVAGYGADHAGHPLDVGEDTLLALNDLLLDFLRRRSAPAGENENTRRGKLREQLDGQSVDGQRTKPEHQHGGNQSRCGVAHGEFYYVHGIAPCETELCHAV